MSAIPRSLIVLITLIFVLSGSQAYSQTFWDFMLKRSDFFMGLGTEKLTETTTGFNGDISHSNLILLAVGSEFNYPVILLDSNSSIGIHPCIELAAPLSISDGSQITHFPVLSIPLFITIATGPRAVYRPTISIGGSFGLGIEYGLGLIGSSNAHVYNNSSSNFYPVALAEFCVGKRSTVKLRVKAALTESDLFQTQTNKLSVGNRYQVTLSFDGLMGR